MHRIPACVCITSRAYIFASMWTLPENSNKCLDKTRKRFPTAAFHHLVALFSHTEYKQRSCCRGTYILKAHTYAGFNMYMISYLPTCPSHFCVAFLSTKRKGLFLPPQIKRRVSFLFFLWNLLFPRQKGRHFDSLTGRRVPLCLPILSSFSCLFQTDFQTILVNTHLKKECRQPRANSFDLVSPFSVAFKLRHSVGVDWLWLSAAVIITKTHRWRHTGKEKERQLRVLRVGNTFTNTLETRHVDSSLSVWFK